MNAYYFQRDKTVVLGAKKAQLQFSEGKYQLQNSLNNIPFPTLFYHLNFQLPHPNRSIDYFMVGERVRFLFTRTNHEVICLLYKH